MEEQGVSAAADHEADNDLTRQDHQRQLQGTGDSMRNNALSAFLGVLLQENAAMADVELEVTLVSDNAALLPERYTQSRHLTAARNSCSQSCIPGLSRWESHVVRTPPAVVERKRHDVQDKAAWHASPARPQRRSSFEMDRTHDKLLGDTLSSDSCRSALSQSLNQLSALKPGEVEKLEKKMLPPRVPIRRNSGRVHSPPPEGRSRSRKTLQVQDDDNDETSKFHDESTNFRLEFSESEAFDDLEYAAVQQVAKDIQALRFDTKIDQPPNHRRRSLSPSRLPSATLSSDMQKFTRPASSPSPKPGPRRHGSGTNQATPRRAISLNDDGLPVLETFPIHPPHLRVLPRQSGSRHLGVDERSDSSISSIQTNTAPSQDSSAASQLDLLTKVASSKVRQSFDLGAMKSDLTNMDPPTVEAAIRKTLWTRRKQKVVKSVNSERLNESPLPTREASNDSVFQEAS